MISLNIDEVMLNYRNTQPNYSSVHNWLKRNFGNADRCENKECKNPSHAFQWAKIKDKDYDFKRENFIMLCGRCHYYYDEKYKRYQKLDPPKNIFDSQLSLSF